MLAAPSSSRAGSEDSEGAAAPRAGAGDGSAPGGAAPGASEAADADGPVAAESFPAGGAAREPVSPPVRERAAGDGSSGESDVEEIWADGPPGGGGVGVEAPARVPERVHQAPQPSDRDRELAGPGPGARAGAGAGIVEARLAPPLEPFCGSGGLPLEPFCGSGGLPSPGAADAEAPRRGGEGQACDSAREGCAEEAAPPPPPLPTVAPTRVPTVHSPTPSLAGGDRGGCSERKEAG